VAVGLGSNLGERSRHLGHGLHGLSHLLAKMRVSPVYESRPLGDVRQPDFLNLCCVGVTELPARSLLEAMHRLEREAGRRRTARRFGPRTLDLDLLLYGDQVLREEGLEVPHARMTGRAFVLLPLRDLAPDWRHPVLGRTVAELAAAVDPGDVRPFGDPPTAEGGWKVEPAEPGRPGEGQADAMV
jgi:2-amino-4-hydroxy-6-hydroxymethyldihydropteridine diphosphokinase